MQRNRLVARDWTPPAALLQAEMEASLRILACYLIRRAGRLLRLPQAAILTAQILLHQFYCQQPTTRWPPEDAALGCLLVTVKVEECHRRVRDLVNAMHWIHCDLRKGEEGDYHHLGYVSEAYYGWRGRACEAELQVLTALGYHVQPVKATALLINYARALALHETTLQLAISLLNDAHATMITVHCQPWEIACAAISVAVEMQTEAGQTGSKDEHGEETTSKMVSTTLPKDWHEVFDCDGKALAVARSFIKSQPKVDPSLPLDLSEMERFVGERFPKRSKQ